MIGVIRKVAMAVAGRRTLSASRALWAGPLLLVASLAAWAISDRLVVIGPFDRAQIGWAVVVPLFVLAPGVLSLAWQSASTARTGRGVLVALSAAIGVLAVGALALTSVQIGCRTVASPIDVIPSALPVGVVAALAFAVSVLIGAQFGKHGRMRAAVLVGGGTAFVGLWATVAAFVVIFPAPSCAPVPM